MRALTKWAWIAGCAATGALLCAAPEAGARDRRAAPASAPSVSPGQMPPGSPVVTMADQYNRPHPGPPATGATAWVPPSPPPAYVDTSPPPPRAPEPPPLGAVRNRQPGDAAEAPRPELSGSAPAPVLAAADMAKGRQIFGANGCGGCHTLADAGGAGGIGPGLDRNPRLSPDYVFNTVHDGRGGMPSFAGQISDPDLRTLANYVVAASKK